MRPIFPLLICVFLASCTNSDAPIDPQIEVTNTSVVLKTSIGLESLPTDSESICALDFYTSADYQVNAIARGEIINDFTLYDLNGSAINLRAELEDEKPILLMSGSFTCPIFRRSSKDLEMLLSEFESDLKALIIYTTEAHPDVDPSPYKGEEWEAQANINQGFFYRQPTTYGERKAMVEVMMEEERMSIPCPVLIDGPCNEWWTSFGEAPNRAYLVRPNGMVYVSHGWFDYETMRESILSLMDELKNN